MLQSFSSFKLYNRYMPPKYNYVQWISGYATKFWKFETRNQEKSFILYSLYVSVFICSRENLPFSTAFWAAFQMYFEEFSSRYHVFPYSFWKREWYKWVSHSITWILSSGVQETQNKWPIRSAAHHGSYSGYMYLYLIPVAEKVITLLFQKVLRNVLLPGKQRCTIKSTIFLQKSRKPPTTKNL